MKFLALRQFVCRHLGHREMSAGPYEVGNVIVKLACCLRCGMVHVSAMPNLFYGVPSHGIAPPAALPERRAMH